MDYIEIDRAGGRALDEMRPVALTRDVLKHALGSCLVEFGDTRVLCAATIEEGVPGWRKASRAGWVTAEYAMLPASTGRRTARERGNRKGRSMEIERLIGRSLRTVTNMRMLGECTVTVDCDVLQADGGTRLPLTGQVAAVSMGVVDGCELLDLDYREDSRAEVDMNLVATDTAEIVEIQGTGERMPFDRARLGRLLDLGDKGIAKLIELQNEVTAFRDDD